jgi:enamine deaminase RidA (YjgF/YER057c/UK114 family)
VFLDDIEDFDEVNETYAEFSEANRPPVAPSKRRTCRKGSASR